MQQTAVTSKDGYDTQCQRADLTRRPSRMLPFDYCTGHPDWSLLVPQFPDGGCPPAGPMAIQKAVTKISMVAGPWAE